MAKKQRSRELTGVENVSVERIGEIFRKIDDVRYYLANDKSYLQDIIHEGELISELDEVVTRLELLFISKVAQGTSACHPREDD